MPVNTPKEKLPPEAVRSLEASSIFVPSKVEILLAALEEKPAALLEVPAKPGYDPEEYLQLVGALGLWSSRIPMGSVGTILTISRSEESLVALNDAFQDYDEQGMGAAFGYPPTATEAFIQGRGISARSLEDADPEAVAFISYKVSPENAATEIAVAKRWARAVESVCPTIHSDMLHLSRVLPRQ